jgi:hypothetical protein
MTQSVDSMWQVATTYRPSAVRLWTVLFSVVTDFIRFDTDKPFRQAVLRKHTSVKRHFLGNVLAVLLKGS